MWTSTFIFALFSIAGAAPEKLHAKTYDYIIVGGGTAGVALATRLSQRLPYFSILLIEAGPAAFSELGINVPGRKGSTLGSKYDWNFTTMPQKNANNRIIPQNRGKVLGGSSAINLMTYDRASAHEYDGWEEVGNPGWNWKDFSAMMDRAENFTSGHTEWYGDAGVSTSGPIKGTINRFIPAHQNGWVPTMNSLGLPTNGEYMGGNVLGVCHSPSSIDPEGYKRSYSVAYLPLARANLVVVTDALVVKINLENRGDGSMARATGVMLANGTFIFASREVILSAGSFGSPGLLEVSGIGNKTILDTAGIYQIVDLPGVGENLQDHIRIQSTYEVKPKYTSVDILRYNTTYANAQLKLWLTGNYSMYDYTGSGYAFMSWPQAIGNDSILKAVASAAIGSSTHPTNKKKLQWLSDPTIPQLEIIMSDGYTGLNGYPSPTNPNYGRGFFALIAAIMHPLSRGSVHVNTSSPLSAPIIDPNYLSSEYDIQSAIYALKKMRQIASTPPLRDIWISEYEPVLENRTTEKEWRELVLGNVLSIYHPVGSCSMLPRNEGGVVDARLRVYGTGNLRVVDASVIPVLISAHLQTAVYGIAEMAAEKIIQDASA